MFEQESNGAVCEAEETKIQTKRKYGIVRPKKENTQQKSKEYEAATWKEKKKETTESVLSTALFSMDDASNAGVRRKKTKTKQNKIGENVCLCTMVHSGQWQRQQQR